MSDDAKNDDATSSAAADAPTKRGKRNAPGTPLKVRGPGQRGAYSHGARKAMAAYVLELRADGTMMKWSDVIAAVRERFGCGQAVAERAHAEAAQAGRDAFYKRVWEAPVMIFDGYVEIFQTCMKDGDMREARKTLDSLRDMFGIKGAVNVNLNINAAAPSADDIPFDAFESFSDEEMAVLMKLDAARPGVIDVPSGDAAMDDVASAGVDAVAAAGEDGDDGL